MRPPDRPQTLTLRDDGRIPNSPLPALVYRNVPRARDPDDCERLFGAHGWLGAWRDGIFSFHHFHSTAHEVLGNIRAVPLPEADPVLGATGPLTELWRRDA